MKQLTIISHTEHYKTADGEVVGFGATVTEINHLLEVFDEIIHVAVLYDGIPPKSALPYTSKHINFVALPVIGGKSFFDKTNVVLQAPRILNTIHKALKKSTYFQFRAPTGMGVYVIPYLILFNAKKGWFKYAGNWKQEQAPLAYQFQYWLLKTQNRPVTINGLWPNQPKHCLSFENPCLTQTELQQGSLCRKLKVLPKRKSFCFVGRLDVSKGIHIFIESLKQLSEFHKTLIDTVHIIGEGSHGAMYQKDLESSGILSVYHGTLSRTALQHIYEKCHFIVLPSQSEGFPKVISEALNYGCIPIVSNVSAIGQYIRDGVQGILINDLSENGLRSKLEHCLSMSTSEYKNFISQPEAFYNQFTYSFYNNRIEKEILKRN
jgi:glycosyltransferase involved in cell wall biosynthesis